MSKLLPLRTIGVEIECYYLSESEEIVNSMCNSTGAKHADDGSINIPEGLDDYGDLLYQSAEINSKPMAGVDFMQHLAAITEGLQDAQAQTNKSCGLHVHVDASEIAPRRLLLQSEPSGDIAHLYTPLYVPYEMSLQSPFSLFLEVDKSIRSHGLYHATIEGAERSERALAEVITGRSNSIDGYIVQEKEVALVWIQEEALCRAARTLERSIAFLAAAESVVRSLLPASRRKNTYCNPIVEIMPTGPIVGKSYTEVWESITGRYSGFNFQSLPKHGTIECRYHGGTVEYNKILHWARFVERLVAVSLSDGVEDKIEQLRTIVGERYKLKALFSMLGLPDETEQYLLARYKRFLYVDGDRVKTIVANNKQAVEKVYTTSTTDTSICVE